MYYIRKILTQGGADTTATAEIATGLTVDGKSGWRIDFISAYIPLINTAVTTADTSVSILLTTDGIATKPTDEEVIVGAYRATAGTAASTSSYVVDPVIIGRPVIEDRITVQPILHLALSSTATGATLVGYFIIAYELVKLTDLEVMRLSVAGS